MFEKKRHISMCDDSPKETVNSEDDESVIVITVNVVWALLGLTVY